MEYELIQSDKDDAYDVAPFLSYARARSQDRAERDPIVGDTVHVWFGGACRAAIITQDDVDTWCVSFLMPGETSWRPAREVPHSEDRKGLSWHWPCGGH